MFDDPVVALGAAVADSGEQSGDDRVLPRVDRPCEPAELGDTGVGAVRVEIGEPIPDEVSVRVGAGQAEQVAEQFLALPALLEGLGILISRD